MLLSLEIAELIADRAMKQSLENKDYRFGQALTNLIPSDLYHSTNATGIDFFYEPNDEKVIKLFYEHYVCSDEHEHEIDDDEGSWVVTIKKSKVIKVERMIIRGNDIDYAEDEASEEQKEELFNYFMMP